MRRGYHWLARMPHGKYAILYADPVLKEVHRQRGAFPTEREAFAFARQQRFNIQQLNENLDAAPEKRPRANRKTVLQDAVLQQLPAIFKDHPNGVTIFNVGQLFDIDYDKARQLVIWLHSNGYGKWTRDKEHHGARKCLMPIATDEVAESELTFNQRSVLDVLSKHANKEGLIKEPVARIAQEAGVARGSITFVLHELQRKECIDIVSMEIAARGGMSTVFRLRQKGERARAYYQRAAKSAE